jgi:TPR repeat protein
MTAFMHPPVADEPAPRSAAQLAFTAIALILVVMVGFHYARPPRFDEAAITPIVSPVADKLALARETYRRGDVAAAFGLLRALADGGDARAARNIGWLLASGFGGRHLRDRCQAVPWFDQAARAGEPFAMVMLSDSYARGVGVERDDALAHLWDLQWQTHYEDAAVEDWRYAHALAWVLRGQR